MEQGTGLFSDGREYLEAHGIKWKRAAQEEIDKYEKENPILDRISKECFGISLDKYLDRFQPIKE